MGKRPARLLSTQPVAEPATVPLRSGFSALPVATSPSSEWHYVFARTQPAEPTQLFITSLPLGATTATLSRSFAPLGAITDVALLPSPLPSTSNTLLTPSTPHPHSAILTFASPPPFPPAPNTLRLTLKHLTDSPPSFLAASLQKHALQRPHLSTIIAHTDEWMASYDARKLASLPDRYDPAAFLKDSKTKAAKGKKGKKSKDVGPLPGSAAHALALLKAERNRPREELDEVQEGEWTLVARGGRHGKSLLPAGAQPTMDGYGGVSVKVARRGGVPSGSEDAGIKKIVGDGFYRFTRDQKRAEDLMKLKDGFEEDKKRLETFRSRGGSFRGRGRGRGAGAGSRGGAGGRFKPY